MPALIAILGKVGASIGASLIASLMTEKVIMRVMLILGDKLVKSTKNDLDDQVFAEMKKSIEAELSK